MRVRAPKVLRNERNEKVLYIMRSYTVRLADCFQREERNKKFRFSQI